MSDEKRPSIFEYFDVKFDKVEEKLEAITTNQHGIDLKLQRLEDKRPSEPCMEYFAKEHGKVLEKCTVMKQDVDAIAGDHRNQLAKINVELAKKPDYNWVRKAIGASFGIIVGVVTVVIAVLKFFGIV